MVLGTDTTVQIRDLAALALVAAQALDEKTADQQMQIDELKRAMAECPYHGRQQHGRAARPRRGAFPSGPP